MAQRNGDIYLTKLRFFSKILKKMTNFGKN